MGRLPSRTRHGSLNGAPVLEWSSTDPGVLLVPMVLVPGFWLAGACYFVRMLTQRVGVPLRQSFTQDMADPSERASLAALSILPWHATTATSQLLAGYLFDEVSLTAPFELAAAFQCLNACSTHSVRSGPPPSRSGP